MVKTLESGTNSRGARRGPLDRGGNGVRRGRVLPAAAPEDRADLDRRSQRHQHARELRRAATCMACRWAPSWDCGPPLANIYDFSPKVQPENCVLVGIRDVDANERENIKRSGVQAFHHARHRRARHAYGDGRGAAPGRTRHGGLSRLARHGLDRSRGRAGRGHSGVGRGDLSRRRTWRWRLSPITAAC